MPVSIDQVTVKRAFDALEAIYNRLSFVGKTDTLYEYKALVEFIAAVQEIAPRQKEEIKR